MNILNLLNITKGTLINKIDLNVKINKFKTNSKDISENDCFISINNNSKYIGEAIKNKASCIIVSKKINYNIPTILVQDIIKTLGKLTTYIRNKNNIKVIAITGSTGKTTTRELLYDILSKKYKCHRNIKNYNNHIGVPLTFFSLENNDEIVIAEMGMNHFNEIKYLSLMTTPDIAIITNIGSSHIGNLGTKENILKAKLEIKEGLKGPLFVNGDDLLLKNIDAYKCGFNQNNDLVAYNLFSDLNNSTFDIKINNEVHKIKVNLPRHLLNDVLLAINVGLYLNIDIEDIKKALENYKTYDMRMNILKDNNNNTIINDCYNSSFESLSGILNVIKNENGKKLLILGDINEIGIYSEVIYENIEKILDKIDNKDVILIGNEIRYKNYNRFKNYKDAINYLKNIQIKDTLILIKASRSLKLENITSYLLSFH